jgi:tRNA pseudouridine 55 synthase
MLKGFYNVLKPTGMTSSDVVVKLRGILRSKTHEQQKVGHLGTLDPGGAGVLPIAVGRATKLFDYVQKEGKVYRAGFRFGVETDTLDSFGKVTKKCDVLPDLSEILAVIPKFIGKIVQVPPAYSSVYVNGQHSYDLARKGREAELSGREIEIYSLDFVEERNGILFLILRVAAAPISEALRVTSRRSLIRLRI